MSLDDAIPNLALSETEEELVREIFTNPLLRKFLRIMALNDAKELLSLSVIGNDKDTLAQAHAVVQGKLQVVSTLLSIEAPQSQQPN